MNYNWNIKHSPKPPCMVSHYAHADVLRMKQNIEQSKTVYISVGKRTKTTLDINLYHVIAELNLSVDTLNVDMNIIGVEELKAA